MFLPEELEVLNPHQIQMINDRVQGLSYEQLRTKYDFASNQSITKYLTQTLLGIALPENKCLDGRLPLLGDVPRVIFIKKANERAQQNNCLKTNQAVSLIEDVISTYLFHSYQLAHQMHCPYLAASIMKRLETLDLSPQWLNHFCYKNGFRLITPQSLEILRNRYCHQAVILQFHQMLQRTIHNVPHLLFNADETSSSFNKKGKIIVPDGRAPLAEDGLIIGHYTMVCCTNAIGDKFLPFIIIPSRKTLPNEIADLQVSAQFASSPSGWMTSKLFLAWCFSFVHQLNEYKIKIKNVLERHNATHLPTFLFLDGHKSRLNSEAIEYLYAHNVHVIIFPPHTSHVYQPFDIGIAAPLKGNIKKMQERIPSFLSKQMAPLTKTEANRLLIVHTLIDAWSAAATPRNIQSAWAKSGIFPLDYTPLANNLLIRQTNPDDIMAPQHNLAIGGELITTPAMRLQIAQHFYKNPNLYNIPVPSDDYIINLITHGEELILTPPPPHPIEFPMFPGVVYYRYY